MITKDYWRLPETTEISGDYWRLLEITGDYKDGYGLLQITGNYTKALLLEVHPCSWDFYYP